MLSQVFRHDRSRNAGGVEASFDVQAGGDDGCLDRVQHVEAWGHVPKAVPAFFAVALHAFAVGTA